MKIVSILAMLALGACASQPVPDYVPIKTNAVDSGGHSVMTHYSVQDIDGPSTGTN